MLGFKKKSFKYTFLGIKIMFLYFTTFEKYEKVFREYKKIPQKIITIMQK